jgi:uncharacterized protein YggU (UPF0235/DUF167 family)
VRVELHVQPGARSASVGGTHDGRLIVRVPVAAEKGRANAAVLRAVAAAVGVPVRDVRLLSGTSSRRKVIEIDTGPLDGESVLRRANELRSAAPKGKGRPLGAGSR